MKGKSMKPELKWLLKRIAILKQFDAVDPGTTAIVFRRLAARLFRWHRLLSDRTRDMTPVASFFLHLAETWHVLMGTLHPRDHRRRASRLLAPAAPL